MAAKNTMKRKGAVVLIAVLTACALFLANFLMHRHFIRLDLTEDKEYTLSDSTKKILKSLDDRVTIKLYFTERLPPDLQTLQQQVNDLLDEFRVYSDSKVNVVRIVPESSAKNEQEAQIVGIPPLQLNVVQRDKQEVQKVYLGAGIFYGDKQEILPVIANAATLEYDLTAAILKLTSAKLPKLGLLLPTRTENGMGPYQAIAKLLGEQIDVTNLTPDAKDLIQQGLDVLLVIEPREIPAAFTAEMDRLLEAGTPVVVFSGNVEVQPNLEAVSYKTGLEEWLKGKGIELTPEVLIDPKKPARASFNTGFVQYVIPYPFFIRANEDGLNREHPAFKQVEEVVFPWTNALKITPESHADWKYETLAQTSSAAFLQEGPPMVNPDIFNSLEIKAGEKYPLMAAIEVPGKERPARLIVSASSRFLENNFLRDYQNNVILLQNLVDWLSWGDQLIGIRSRGKGSRPFEPLDSTAVSIIRWSHVAGIPLLVIGAGLIASWLRRRRHRRLAETFNRS